MEPQWQDALSMVELVGQRGRGRGRGRGTCFLRRVCAGGSGELDFGFGGCVGHGDGRKARSRRVDFDLKTRKT
jgi:hypothetical protein